MPDLDNTTRMVFQQCFKLRPSETILIVSDGHDPELALSFYRRAVELAKEALLMQFTPRSRHGEEPPRAVSQAMCHVDAAVLCTAFSLSHTRARREACAAGARIASMPSVTAEIAARSLGLDYASLAERTAVYARVLSEGREAYLTSPADTSISFLLEGRSALSDDGSLAEPGACSNLPAGEAYIAPVEGSATGKLVFDGSLSGWGKLDAPVTVDVEKGKACRISGGKEAQWLEKQLEECAAPARNIAELGIGTNDRARLSGVIIEDEKAAGTVHVALGDNSSFGGTVEAGIHIDGLILSPTLSIDGRVIIESGRMLL